MIKVKDGYAKLIGTTYQGSATLVLLSNGGNLEFSSATKANTLVLRNASLHIYATYFNSAISDEALTDIGSVYIRNTSDTFIRRISKTQFYSIIDNKFVTLDTALTITGVKTFSTGPILANNATITLNLNSTGNYTTVVKWLKGGTSQGTYNPSIGLHNTGGDGKGSICILPYPTETSPWGGTVGLFISKGVLRLDGKSVAIAENYYTKTESDNRYVNVTGDTMTGPLIVKATVTGTLLISTIATGTSPLKVTSTTVVTNLNSDLLDGFHETDFVRSFWTSSPGYDCSKYNSRPIISFTYSNNAPFTGGFIDVNTRGYGFYLGTAYSGNAPLYYRRHGISTDGGMGTWLQLARITDNVASATKLQTARTINGTLFDGTANITTAYWGATRTITLSGAVTGSASVNGSLNVTITTTYQTGSLDGRYVRKIGDVMTGGLKNTAVDAYRLAYGSYGTILRNDGSSFYILLTDSGAALSGGYNSLRPFAITLSTGAVRIGHGLTVSGTVVGYSTIQGTRLISTATSGTAPLTVASNTLVSNLNSDLLDNYHLADILPNSIFHATLGSLVTTDISSASDSMVTVNITGNSYGSGRVINTVLLFYNYHSGDYIGAATATNFGFNFGTFLIFNYNGKVCFWFKLTANYLSYTITARVTNSSVQYNRVATITNAAMPTTGVTRLISVTPYQGAYLDSNVASATKLLTARNINGTLFNGTSDITTARWGYARTLTLTGSITGSATIDGSGNVSMATTYLAGNIGNLDARYVNVTGDTMTGKLSWTMNGVTSSISNENSSYTHYNTNASSGHWFNKNVHVSGNVYGGSSYNRILAFKDEINSQVGGSKSAQMNWASWGTDTYGGAIQIREQGLVTNKQSAWGYSPALTFHWSNRHAKRFGMRSDGQFAVDDVPISLSTHNHNSLYVTALGTNGNYLTWTKNGTTNNITVPYATTSAYLTNGFSAAFINKWDCNAPDRVVYSDYGSSGRSVTNAPSGWNYGTLLELGHINYRGLNGSLNILLMWDVAHNTTNPGTLWFRGKDSVKGWAKSWAKVITDQNFTSILNNTYVNKTGDTMSGGIDWTSLDSKYIIKTGTNNYISYDGSPGSSMVYWNGGGTILGSNNGYTYIRSTASNLIHIYAGTQYTILDARNYNSYSPTLTGGGASGTWGINITGSSRLLYFNQSAAVANTLMTGAGLYYNQVSSSTDTGYPSDYGHVIRLQRGVSTTLTSSQLVLDLFHPTGAAGLNQLYLRTGYGDGSKMVWGSFVQLLHTGNYTSLITKIGTTTVGGTAKGIYLNGGTPTAMSATVGSTTLPVYMNAGTITACSTTLGVSVTGYSKRLLETVLTNEDLNTYTYSSYSGRTFTGTGGNTVTNKPSGLDSFGLLVLRSAGGYTTQLAYSGSDLYARYYNGTTWYAWTKFAHITDNVASATKLQTARSIFGQSFNGTANVAGKGTFYGSAVSAGSGYGNGALQIREAGQVGNAQTSDQYAPRIGFHWSSRFGYSLIANSGEFKFQNQAETGYVNIRANGFIKNGSSNAYVLLGGGGHKAVSDFATSGHTHSYLPLSGGTMTGNITFPNNAGIIQNQKTTSNYTKAISWNVDGTPKAQIGSHNTGGDGTGSITILPYTTTTDAWSGSVGLFVYKGGAKIDGAQVLTSGNYTGTLDGRYANILTFSAGRFSSKTYNGSSAITVNVPTHTSHLTNDSGFWTGTRYWANIAVSASSSTGTSPTFSTAYTSNWFRSTGNTGWYSETYGGGWHMTDTTYIRAYNSKRVYSANTSLYAFYTPGGMTAAGFWHTAVNSNSYVLLAAGYYKSLEDFAKGNAGSATKGVYVTGGTVTAMTYSLSSNLNSGTSGKLAYYSGSTTVVAYSSSVGANNRGVYMNAGVPTIMTYYLNATVNSGTTNKLAYYSTASTIAAYTSTVGSIYLPVYMNSGVPTVITYYLNATVNSGTSGKLAYYSGANALSSYTSTVGSVYSPVYMNAGVPTICSYYSFLGAAQQPIVLISGYFYRFNNTSNYWYYDGYKHSLIGSPSFYINGGVMRLTFSNSNSVKFISATAQGRRNFAGSDTSNTLPYDGSSGDYSWRSEGAYWFNSYVANNVTTSYLYVRAYRLADNNNDLWYSGSSCWRNEEDAIESVAFTIFGYILP